MRRHTSGCVMGGGLRSRGAALVVLSMLWVGCADESGQESPPWRGEEPREPIPRVTSLPVEVDAEGALRFPSIAAFFQVSEALARMSAAERDVWEEQLGFLSMRRAYAALEAELERRPAKEHPLVLAAHRDILDPESPEPRRRVATSAYAWLVDRRGVMYIDGVIHRVNEREVWTPRPGAGAEVTRQLAGDVTAAGTKQLEGVDAFRYRSEEASLSQCGAAHENTLTVGDRRVTYRMEVSRVKVVDGIGNRQYRHAYYVDFWGKRKVLGVWVAYATTYQMYNTFGYIDVFKVTGFDGVRHQYVYERQDRGWYSLDLGPETSHFDSPPAWAGDAVQNIDESQLIDPFFHKLHMEVTSRGTYPTRGRFECNYCGDGTCQSFVSETAYNCPGDCNQCGDGICAGSDPTTCPSDCPPPDPDPPCDGTFCP